MDRRFSDYVTFVSGVNPTRASKQIDDVIVYYEQSDFNNDFKDKNKLYEAEKWALLAQKNGMPITGLLTEIQTEKQNLKR